MRAFLTGGKPGVIRTEVGSISGVPPEYVTSDGRSLYRFYLIRPKDGVAFYNHIGRIGFTTEYEVDWLDSDRELTEVPVSNDPKTS